MKYNYTIIIPHKNVPSLLKRCLDSIPVRGDLQIIIVDDNSSSSIVDFNNFPGKERNDVIIIYTKEGRGAGYARNVGLLLTDSKWVLFADADDFYSDNFNSFLDKYAETDYDLVFYQNCTVDNNTLKQVDKDLFVKDLTKECEIVNNLDPLRYKAYAPWTKLVNKRLIDEYKIKFDELPAANDSLFSVKVGHYAQRIKVDNTIIYTRTIRSGSLFYSLNKKNLLARIECGYRVNKFLKEHNKLRDYHSETWGHLLDLRRISWLLFLKTSIVYFIKTPYFITSKHIRYIIRKRLHF